MKYERLTIKRENCFATVRNTTLQGLIDRLAELEDKIEAGTLVEVPQGAVVLTPEEFSVKIGSDWCAVVKSRDIDELVKEV